MIKLLEFLFTGCWHKWETIKEQQMGLRGKVFRGNREYDTHHVYTEYTLRCKNCGEIKYVDVGKYEDK